MSVFKRFWKGLNATSINRSEFFEYQKHQNAEDRSHLPVIKGLCETDVGLGLIEKIEYDCDHTFAKSLETYGPAAYRHRKQIEEFIHWVRHTDLIIYDLYLCNILISFRNFKPSCILIDGFGDTGLIPRRQLSKSRNHRKILVK